MLQGLKKGSADYCGSSNIQQVDKRRHKQPMPDYRVHIYQPAICMPNNLNCVQMKIYACLCMGVELGLFT